MPYSLAVKTVRYLRGAQRDLKRYANMAERVRKALAEYVADPKAHANNVTKMVGSSGKRMVIGDFRVLFEETETELIVTKIGPRGSIYDD